MPVKNESWVLGLSIRVALQWCDELLVLLHDCTDDSEAIVFDAYHDFPGRLTVAARETGYWDEMAHRHRLLTLAREQKATHIAIVDADELLTSNVSREGLRSSIENMPRGFMLQLPGYNLRGGLTRYHSNGIWGRRWFSAVFLDEPHYGWSGDCFHSREPQGGGFREYRPIEHGQGGVMHLWGASERRLKAKHALYKIQERLRWPSKRVEDIDKMYSWAIHGDSQNRSYGTPGSWTHEKVPSAWWASYEPWTKYYLDVDAVPWQEEECKRLVSEHGPEQFRDFDLFGVV